MWLVAIELVSADIDHFYHHRTLYGTVLVYCSHLRDGSTPTPSPIFFQARKLEVSLTPSHHRLSNTVHPQALRICPLNVSVHCFPLLPFCKQTDVPCLPAASPDTQEVHSYPNQPFPSLGRPAQSPCLKPLPFFF